MIALLVAACAVGPNYRRPKVAAPAAFRFQRHPGPDRSLADLPWWKIFRDDALQQLVREALANNQDLRIAISRIEQARAVQMQVRANFFPQLGYQTQATRLGGPQQLSIAGLGVPAGQTSNGSRSTSNAFAVAGSASWELDLWGQIRRQSEAATALMLATEEARRGVVQTLVADVAQDYFQLRDLDTELEIARRERAAFVDLVGIFKKQKVGGIASDLEISRATALEAQVAAAIPETEREIALQENALSFLLGRNPGPIRRGAALTAQYSPPAVPAGLPSSLLERRPDIREAEQNLVAANANVGVAVANFLPNLDLTAALGTVSPQLYLLTSGAGNFWNVGGALTGPIFQGGRLIGKYREMKAARDQAVIQYQRTALSAFMDVSNALISRRKYAEVTEQDARQVGALRISVSVVRERYVGGVSTYIELLDPQQQLFPAEIALTRARLQQLVTVVQLYKALGGGWAESERSPERFGFRFGPELRNQ